MAGSGQGFGTPGGESIYAQTAPRSTQYDGGNNRPTYGGFGSGMGTTEVGQPGAATGNNLYPPGMPQPGIPQPGIHQPGMPETGMPQQFASFPGVSAQSPYSPQIQSLPTNSFQGPGMQALAYQGFNPFQGPVANTPTPQKPNYGIFDGGGN